MNCRSRMKVKALKLNPELYAAITRIKDDLQHNKINMKKHLKNLFDIRERIKKNDGKPLILNDRVIYLTDRVYHPIDIEDYMSIDIDRKILRSE